MGSGRAALIASALRLSYFTVAWNGAIGAAALILSAVTGSPALAGLALNALLDSSASVVLVWRFRRERRDPAAAERLERRAHRWITMAMLVVAAYVGYEGIRALVDRAHVEESALGLALAAVSLLVLPWLGRRKLQVARGLHSPALRGDGVLTLAAAALSAITLLALAANSAFGLWWADPCAALLIAGALAVEAIRIIVRHRFG
jgi:divalent metal cation (Fe/Co/Zn/Cd) transporter